MEKYDKLEPCFSVAAATPEMSYVNQNLISDLTSDSKTTMPE